jgi:glycosyltransferase involved in cell wall biosynthesis
MGTLASAAPAAMPGPPRPWSYRLIESRLLRRAALIQYSTEVEERDAERLVIATPSVVIPDVACDAVAGRRAAAGSRAEEAADALASGAIGQWPITIARGVFRRQSGIPRDRPIVLFLAPLQPAMGIDLLLRAFATLRGRLTRALLVVAGDGVPEYVDWTKTEAQSLGLSDDAVIWQAAGTDAEKAALLADADVFALPSYSDADWPVMAEAMAAGLPIVISDLALGNWLEEHPVGQLFLASYDVVFSRFDVVEPDLVYISNARASDIITPLHVEGSPTSSSRSGPQVRGSGTRRSSGSSTSGWRCTSTGSSTPTAT